MQNWDEIRTALHVAREGTVSGAAARLGVHHATVIRYVDALEDRLGVKLFQRHARGYTATEAGEEVLRVGQVTEDQFQALESKLRGKGDEVSGEVVVTVLPTMAAMLYPIIARFQADYPDVKVRLLTSDRIFRLEYGEAHLAIRAGVAPQEPDNVVQKFLEFELGLYASRDYVQTHGRPDSVADFVRHRFIAREAAPGRVPFFRWQSENVPASSIKLTTSDDVGLYHAVKAGIGIGFVEHDTAESDPDLIRVWDRQDDWRVVLWIVTHVDLHRSAKVQAILRYLKQYAASKAR